MHAEPCRSETYLWLREGNLPSSGAGLTQALRCSADPAARTYPGPSYIYVSEAPRLQRIVTFRVTLTETEASDLTSTNDVEQRSGLGAAIG